MRRLLLTGAAFTALALPTAGLALDAAVGDGTLAVRKASGDLWTQPVVMFSIDGAVVGDLDRGRIVVVSFTGSLPVVTDSDGNVLPPTVRDSDGALVYQGTDLRFRAAGGVYKLRIFGRGIDVNAVGRGRVALDGSTATPASDGKFAVNGGEWASLPAAVANYTIGT